VLQALLFGHAFWDTDLSRFVSVESPGFPGLWPQCEIGVIPWGLSAVAEEWQSLDALTALCTVPNEEIPETRLEQASAMFVRRKSALLDRLLSFDVWLAERPPAGH